MGITIFCNILLFVSTALTIAHYKKNTDQHLKNSANKGYDDKKQWFALRHIKYFINVYIDIFVYEQLHVVLVFILSKEIFLNYIFLIAIYFHSL